MNKIKIIQNENPAILDHGDLVHGKLGYQYLIRVIEDPQLDDFVNDDSLNCIPISLFCDNPLDFFSLHFFNDSAKIAADLFVYKDKLPLLDNTLRLSTAVCPTHYLTKNTARLIDLSDLLLDSDLINIIMDINANRFRYLPTSIDNPSAIENCLLGSGEEFNFLNDGVNVLTRCVLNINNGDKVLCWTWVRHYS